MPAVLPYEVTLDTPMEDFPDGDQLYRSDHFLLWRHGNLRIPPFSDKFLYKDSNVAFYFFAARDRLISEYPLVTESLNKYVVHRLWLAETSGVGRLTIEKHFKETALKNIKAGLPHVKLPYGLETPSEVEFICN